MESRLSDRNNLINRLTASKPAVKAELDTKKFKTDGTPRDVPLISEEQKAAIGTLAIIEGAKEAAAQFKVSPATASKFAAGIAGETKDLIKNEERNAHLRSEIYNNLGEVREKARLKLMDVLDKIEPKDIDALQPAARLNTAANVAAKLSAVIDKTIEKGANFADQRSAHLHLYAPEQKAKETYTIKSVGAKIPLDNASDNSNANIIDVQPTGQEA